MRLSVAPCESTVSRLLPGLLALSVCLSAAEFPQGQKRRYPIAKETTVVTEPLNADGSVDFAGWIDAEQRRGVVLDQNANAALRRLLGSRDVSQQHRAEYYRKLGLPEPPDPVSLLFNQGDVINLRGDAARAELQSAVVWPWKPEDLPVAYEWIDRNTNLLTEVRAAAALPQYYSPVHPSGGRLSMMLLPDTQSIRSFARLLIADAMLSLGTGQEGTALEDLLACHRLAGHVGNGWTLVENLVSFAISNMTSEAEAVYLNRARPNAAKMRFWRRRLTTVRQPCAVWQTIDRFERLIVIDVVVAIERGDDIEPLLRSSGQSMPPATRAAFVLRRKHPEVDFGSVLIELNRRYDRIAKVLREEAPASRSENARELEARSRESRRKVQETTAAELLASEENVAKYITELVYGGFGPAIRAARSAELRTQARRAVVNVGWSLSAYYADHNAWPDSLQDLVPRYIEKLPLDPFNKQPLRFSAQQQRCRVYSVGPNLKDDGGEKMPANPKSPDIVLQLDR